jgi:hypothetical protein
MATGGSFTAAVEMERAKIADKGKAAWVGFAYWLIQISKLMSFNVLEAMLLASDAVDLLPSPTNPSNSTVETHPRQQ